MRKGEAKCSYDFAKGVLFSAKDPIGFAGGDTDLYGYCLNDPVNCFDINGLLVGTIGVGLAGGGFGHDETGKDYVATQAGIYGETSLSSKREWGRYASIGAGEIHGAAAGVGISVGLSLGTIEDLEKVNSITGFNFLGVSFEISANTRPGSGWGGIGFNIGILSRGFGFGLYEINDSATEHHTIKDDYKPFFKRCP